MIKYKESKNKRGFEIQSKSTVKISLIQWKKGNNLPLQKSLNEEIGKK